MASSPIATENRRDHVVAYYLGATPTRLTPAERFERITWAMSDIAALWRAQGRDPLTRSHMDILLDEQARLFGQIRGERDAAA